MKKVLKRIKKHLFYFENGVKKIGANKNMSGDCSGLWGDCSGLWGDCTGLRGYCTGLWGDCTGLWGDCSGLSGDLEEAEMLGKDRKNGIDINDLLICQEDDKEGK